MTPLEKIITALDEAGIPFKVTVGSLSYKGQRPVPKYHLAISGSERKVLYRFDIEGNYEEIIHL